MGIKENLELVKQKIRKSAEKSGRDFNDIKLLVATKYCDIEQIKEIISQGVKCIGENVVQEAARKFPCLPEVEKHMIGH